MRTLAALIGAAALALASLVVAPLAAPAAGVPQCSSSAVLVVVDLRSFGGRVASECAVDPSNGYAALHQAGFSTEDVMRQPGFICRINGEPSSDPCRNTPPATAYWSYWQAAKGSNEWTYSKLGAGSSHPEPGAIEAWVFGATNVKGTSGHPSFCPNYARTGKQSSCPSSSSGGGGGSHDKPKPGRTTAKPDRRGGSAGSGGAGGAGSSSAQRSPSASGSSSASPTAKKSSSAASSSKPSSGTATTAPAASGTSGSLPAIVDASEVAGKDNSAGGGSATPVILGALLVVLLGGGAGWTVLRRRRADAADL